MTVLDSILGTRTLDARAEWVVAREDFHLREEARTFALRLDGRWFLWQENPCDGYRSTCEAPLEVPAAVVPVDAAATFPPRTVMVSQNADAQRYDAHRDVVIGVDQATGVELFQVGTDSTLDYYPRFIARWTPPGEV